MVKWLVSLVRFASVTVLWAHLFRSVPRVALQAWILVGLVHDLLCPTWIIIQDVLNKPVPDSSYPPLYRIVLLLSFRFYVYYFVHKFSQEMPPPEENTWSPAAAASPGSGTGLLWCGSACKGSSNSSFSYSNPSLEDDDGQPCGEPKDQPSGVTESPPEQPPSPVKKSVQFDPQPPVTLEANYSEEVSKGESSSSSTSSSLEAALPQEPVAIELAHLLRTWGRDLDSMARVVRLLFIIEIVWNAYVLLIHEVRFGIASQSRHPHPARGPITAYDDSLRQGIFSINETVTLEMIWIRIGFIAISAAGLLMLRIQVLSPSCRLIPLISAILIQCLFSGFDGPR
jgi:hypothetical protein